VPRFPLIALAGIIVLASGCAGPQHRDLAVEYHPGETTQTLRLPYDATYELYTITESGVWETPINRTALLKDEHVGFVRELDDSLVGYVAGRKIPLTEGSYRWQITPETRRSVNYWYQEAGTKTVLVIAAVTICVGAAALCIFVLKIIGKNGEISL
jgi:hypothetical protein